MKITVFCLMAQTFFREWGTDYASAMTSRDLHTFSTTQECFQRLDELTEKAKARGYRVVNSEYGEDVYDFAFRARWENNANRAVVFTIFSRIVEGEPFTYG